MDDNERDSLLIETHAMVRELKACVGPIDAQTKKNTADIEELKLKPGKRWDAAVMAFVMGVIGVITGKFIK